MSSEEQHCYRFRFFQTGVGFIKRVRVVKESRLVAKFRYWSYVAPKDRREVQSRIDTLVHSVPSGKDLERGAHCLIESYLDERVHARLEQFEDDRDYTITNFIGGLYGGFPISRRLGFDLMVNYKGDISREKLADLEGINHYVLTGEKKKTL
jgi:hypothetical protein